MRGDLLLPCVRLAGRAAGVRATADVPADRPTRRRAAGRAVRRSAVRWCHGRGCGPRSRNPNPFGFTLGTLDGTLFLEGTRAAAAAFPLGLPLGAGQQSVVPLELSVSFSDLPALADVVRRAARRESVEYRLDGTIGVDAGRLGQPVFGPMTLDAGGLSADASPDRTIADRNP